LIVRLWRKKLKLQGVDERYRRPEFKVSTRGIDQTLGAKGPLASGDKLRSPKAAGHAEQKVDKWWSNSAVY
jgi:hypothetical protein